MTSCNDTRLIGRPISSTERALRTLDADDDNLLSVRDTIPVTLINNARIDDVPARFFMSSHKIET